MIEPTEADIGRRVVYEWSDGKKVHCDRGTLVGIGDNSRPRVQFDGSEGWLHVISNLHWADALPLTPMESR